MTIKSLNFEYNEEHRVGDILYRAKVKDFKLARGNGITCSAKIEKFLIREVEQIEVSFIPPGIKKVKKEKGRFMARVSESYCFVLSGGQTVDSRHSFDLRGALIGDAKNQNLYLDEQLLDTLFRHLETGLLKWLNSSCDEKF